MTKAFHAGGIAGRSVRLLVNCSVIGKEREDVVAIIEQEKLIWSERRTEIRIRCLLLISTGGLFSVAVMLDSLEGVFDIGSGKSCKLKAQRPERTIELIGRSAEICCKGLDRKKVRKDASVEDREDKDCGRKIYRCRKEAWTRFCMSRVRRGAD